MDECLLYSDPELYDALFPDAGSSASIEDGARRERIVESERFYVEEAKRCGGRVLELGCGSGRLTIPIARAGVDIIGADLSESMLAAARVKARNAGLQVEFVAADMRSFALPGPFSAILIPGNSLLHLLTIDELLACLCCVRRHLAPGGRLVFDISKWDLRTIAGNPVQRLPVLTLNDVGRGRIAIDETSEYDAAEQVRHIVWHLSTPEIADFRSIEYRLRVIYPQELIVLLGAAGFDLLERYGEFPRTRFESSSPRQVCICSKRN